MISRMASQTRSRLGSISRKAVAELFSTLALAIQPKRCICGCGKSPKKVSSQFAQGHDMSAKSKIREFLGVRHTKEDFRLEVDQAAREIGGWRLVDWIHSHSDWYDWLWENRLR